MKIWSLIRRKTGGKYRIALNLSNNRPRAVHIIIALQQISFFSYNCTALHARGGQGHCSVSTYQYAEVARFETGVRLCQEKWTSKYDFLPMISNCIGTSRFRFFSNLFLRKLFTYILFSMKSCTKNGKINTTKNGKIFKMAIKPKPSDQMSSRYALVKRNCTFWGVITPRFFIWTLFHRHFVLTFFNVILL